MSVLGTAGMFTLLLKSYNNTILLWKKKTPSWEQKKEAKMIERFNYLKDMYEIEKKKPKYDTDKTPEENYGARSDARLLNLRDKLCRYGAEVSDQLRST